MAEDLTDRRDAVLLAAALREVAGVELDPTTESGAVETGRVVWELMRDQTLLQRLLAVLAKIQESSSKKRSKSLSLNGFLASKILPDRAVTADLTQRPSSSCPWAGMPLPQGDRLGLAPSELQRGSASPPVDWPTVVPERH